MKQEWSKTFAPRAGESREMKRRDLYSYIIGMGPRKPIGSQEAYAEVSKKVLDALLAQRCHPQGCGWVEWGC